MEVRFLKYIPYISGFNDFIICHNDGKPIFLVNGKLYAGLDMLVNINQRYNFTFPETKKEIEDALKENMYMFDVIETNGFYYPNDNMFSGNNSERNIKGHILTVKKKYRKQ